MNPKIKKLQAERQKNDEKISSIKVRNAEIDKQITELENLDIIGLVRSVRLTPEQLAVLIQSKNNIVPMTTEKEESDHEA